MLPAPPNFSLSFATKVQGLKAINQSLEIQSLEIASTFLTMEPGVWICIGTKYHSVNGPDETILQSEKGINTGMMLTHHILVPNSPNNKSDELSPDIRS